MPGERQVEAAKEKAKEGRRGWRLLREFEPGHRFQARYAQARRRRDAGEIPGWARPANIVGGLLLIVAGFLFLPTPGPSYIIVVIGLWMLAGQWLVLARLFDRLEVALRRVGGWLRDRWRGSSPALKVLTVLAAVACVLTLGYALLAG